MIHVIVFDFDGVLVSSNRLKRDAWFEVFAESQGFSRALVEQVLREIPETRFEIAAEILSRVGADPARIEQLVEAAAGRYNAIVQAGIASDAIIPGVADALARYAQSRALYVNSATPEDALAETVGRLGIAKFFKGVYGRPQDKTENLRRIMSESGAEPQEVMMVGDGETDAASARSCGCRFVGIANEWNGWRDREFPLISHISELSALLKPL